jgi:hypothetical protein
MSEMNDDARRAKRLDWLTAALMIASLFTSFALFIAFFDTIVGLHMCGRAWYSGLFRFLLIPIGFFWFFLIPYLMASLGPMGVWASESKARAATTAVACAALVWSSWSYVNSFDCFTTYL